MLGPVSASFNEPFHIGINITASHCKDLELVEDCREFLGAFAPGSIHLVLELTERELIEPTDITLQLFEQLHALGVMIAIDDFGTGHSSLGYLRQFNVDFLKIDQSFVAMIGIDALRGTFWTPSSNSRPSSIWASSPKVWKPKSKVII